MFVRLIQPGDEAVLLAFAGASGVGVTSLPVNPARLQARIAASLASCANPAVSPDVARFLFVLEETDGQVVGICGIEGAVGLGEPWYNYRMGLSVHASRELGIYRRFDILFLTNDLTGSSELCSLFLEPQWRQDSRGALLSKSRFLFMAESPQCFNTRVIAELRGVSDAQGRSPFWESLGRHFFSMDFSAADYLSGIGNKSFIAELMPQHPVYTAFLSEDARAVIGQVHDNTRPARTLLEREGFRYNGYVDIFDGGPTVETALPQIRAIRDSRIWPARLTTAPAGRLWLVSNRQFAGFRVCLAQTEPQASGLPLSAEVLQKLNLLPGDSVRAVPLSTAPAP